MKIKVSLTVEVDEEGWMIDYGVEKSEVREDFRSYVQNVFHSINDNIKSARLS